MNLSNFIARRYLVSKKSTNAINIISGISVAGICIGSAAMVIVLSALNGITGLVISLYNTFDPEIKIMPAAGKTFSMNEALLQKIAKFPRVAHYSKVIEEKALVKYDEKQAIVTLKGVDEHFEKLSRFDTVVRSGRYVLKSDSLPLAVVGGGIASRLDIMPDENGFSYPLHIYIPKKGNTAAITPEDAFNIGLAFPSGIFSLNDDFDYKYMVMPLDFVQQILDKETELSAIEIALQPGSDPDEFAKGLRQELGSNFLVKTRFELNDVLFKTLKSEKWWTFLILAFILLIGTFNVIGSLTMLIIEKKKDIGILAYMGADRALLRNIFMKEGFFITIIGAVSGILLGVGVCLLQQKFQFIPFSEGFVVEAYPVELLWSDILFIFFTVMVIGFAAAWYPVRIFTRKYFN